ncbi:hypothetical protein M529_12595 [Sphingobium ummariense RL-3]|uniref:Uncharacterized protein n=1 Tax=Sphingobium ummariense RL-3 TaxID=1346791 RepID=T0ISI1_9SPHN|nr:hypothetical protein M529_12595 [Sphingobium ummariense RL-3]
MPTKKHKETQEEQSARFRAEVERMVADGELSPTEADIMVDRLTRNIASPKLMPPSDAESNLP